RPACSAWLQRWRTARSAPAGKRALSIKTRCITPMTPCPPAAEPCASRVHCDMGGKDNGGHDNQFFGIPVGIAFTWPAVVRAHSIHAGPRRDTGLRAEEGCRESAFAGL